MSVDGCALSGTEHTKKVQAETVPGTTLNGSGEIPEAGGAEREIEADAAAAAAAPSRGESRSWSEHGGWATRQEGVIKRGTRSRRSYLAGAVPV